MRPHAAPSPHATIPARVAQAPGWLSVSMIRRPNFLHRWNRLESGRCPSCPASAAIEGHEQKRTIPLCCSSQLRLQESLGPRLPSRLSQPPHAPLHRTLDHAARPLRRPQRPRTQGLKHRRRGCRGRTRRRKSSSLMWRPLTPLAHSPIMAAYAAASIRPSKAAMSSRRMRTIQPSP